MTYRILDNKIGVITTRAAALYRPPVSANSTFTITFEGAPKGAVAVFTCNDAIYYRDIVNGKCEVSLHDLDGVVDVAVAMFTNKGQSERWLCEGLIVSHTDSGNVLVMPNDIDLKKEVVELKLENEQLRDEQARLNERLLELDKKLTRIMEGYNIT